MLDRMLATNEPQSGRDQLTLFEEPGGLGYRADMTRCVAMPERCAGPRGTATAEAYVPLSFAPGEAYQFDWSYDFYS